MPFLSAFFGRPISNTPDKRNSTNSILNTLEIVFRRCLPHARGGLLKWSDLHDQRIALVRSSLLRRLYGVDIVYAGKTFIVLSWKIPRDQDQPDKVAKATPVNVSQVDTQPVPSKVKFFD